MDGENLYHRCPTCDLHYHRCPTCHEAVECEQACSIEPDLQDGDRAFAAHWVCDDCEDRKQVWLARAYYTSRERA